MFSNGIVNIINLEVETILLVDVNITYWKQTEHLEIKDMILAQGFKQLVESPTLITEESNVLINIGVVFSSKSSSISFK